MKKTMLKRLLSALLCLLMLLGAFASCNGNKNTTEETTVAENTADDVDPNALTLDHYRIIVSYKIKDDLRDSARRMVSLLQAYTGKDVMLREDDITAEDASYKEILIGATNRAASAESLAGIESGYVIQNKGGTIIINGVDELATADAVEYFIHNIIRKTGDPQGTISLANDFVLKQPYTDVDLKNTPYTIVYSATLDDSVDTTYANNGIDYEVQLAMDLRDLLMDCGANVTVTTDAAAPVANEILLGSTNREENTAFLKSLDYTQYGTGYVNGKIVIAGHGPATTAMAGKLFKTILSKGTTVSLAPVGARSNGNWILSLPEYEGGVLVSVSECYYNEMLYYIAGTTQEEYEAYAAKLEGLGYTKTFENEIEANYFDCYETKKIRVYMSYSANEKVTRLFVGDPDDVEYPQSSTEKYQKVTDMSITQLQLDYNTNSGGMGYVMTLEDGSFFLIDSGSTTNASAASKGLTNNDRVRIWNTLNKLNKRPDGKIVIRGWLITHCHADHINVFRKFCEVYGQKVTIEKYYECVVPSSVAYNSKNPDFHMAAGRVEKAKNQVKGGFDYVALHTGMKFYQYGLNFEILFTIEDHFPSRLHYFNDASTVFRMTVPDQSDDGKCQVLITGDLFTQGSKKLLQRYTAATLKSDILQVSHHGNQGASKAFYRTVAPSTCFWPCSQSSFEELVSGIGTTSYYVIDRYIYTELGVKEHYTNSDYAVQLPLPYAVGYARRFALPTTDQYP
ncbi:MAG: MBL fold metallo-hydrolase [Clostridia bacterium]|nr:MBL fold metallo-hydrolase [Clostridia bacterium]